MKFVAMVGLVVGLVACVPSAPATPPPTSTPTTTTEPLVFCQSLDCPPTPTGEVHGP